MLPAGPAPTTTALDISTGCEGAPSNPFSDSSNASQYKSTILRAKAKAVAERGVDVGGAGCVGDEVHVAAGIWLVQIDRRRQDAAAHCQRGRSDACRTAGALGVTDHGLGRGAGYAIGVGAEHP